MPTRTLRSLSRFTISAFLLAACNPLLDPAGSGAAQPAVEATVLGTWRNAQPSLDGRHFLRMTLRIDTTHSMIWSQRWSANPSVNDTEFSRETWSWTVDNGSLRAVKTHCEYAYPPSYGLTEDTCLDPRARDFPIRVRGNAWTLGEGESTMVFRKDL